MKRRPMRKKDSKRVFSKTASRMHKKNLPRQIVRGGIRL